MTSVDITENGASSSADAAQQVRNAVGLTSESEMAAILQVSEETLATWRSKRRGPPSIKLGKKVFYMINDFSDWVLQEVQKQAALPYTPPRNKPGAKRPSNANAFRRQRALEEAQGLAPAVHVDEAQPGVHVQYCDG